MTPGLKFPGGSISIFSSISCFSSLGLTGLINSGQWKGIKTPAVPMYVYMSPKR